MSSPHKSHHCEKPKPHSGHCEKPHYDHCEKPHSGHCEKPHSGHCEKPHSCHCEKPCKCHCEKPCKCHYKKCCPQDKFLYLWLVIHVMLNHKHKHDDQHKPHSRDHSKSHHSHSHDDDDSSESHHHSSCHSDDDSSDSEECCQRPKPDCPQPKGLKCAEILKRLEKEYHCEFKFSQRCCPLCPVLDLGLTTGVLIRDRHGDYVVDRYAGNVTPQAPMLLRAETRRLPYQNCCGEYLPLAIWDNLVYYY
jgi:hypothetical protein